MASEETYMYADDTSVYCVGNNGNVAVSLLNRASTERQQSCTSGVSETGSHHTLKNARLCSLLGLIITDLFRLFLLGAPW